MKTLWPKAKLWPQCFQKSSAAISSKCVCRWERVKTYENKEYYVAVAISIVIQGEWDNIQLTRPSSEYSAQAYHSLVRKYILLRAQNEAMVLSRS